MEDEAEHLNDAIERRHTRPITRPTDNSIKRRRPKRKLIRHLFGANPFVVSFKFQVEERPEFFAFFAGRA